jgi:signal transduction histidine kinase
MAVPLKLTAKIYRLKTLLSRLAHRTPRWLVFQKFQLALAGICVASVLLTCLLAVAAVSWFQQRDSSNATEASINATLSAAAALVKAGDLVALCNDPDALAGAQSAFFSFSGPITCTVPARADYLALANKATEGDIYPYDQFYTVRWGEKLYRVKSISINRADGPLLLTAGEPIWFLAGTLIRSWVLFLSIMLLLALFSGLTSLIIVRAYIRPLTVMSQEITKIHLLHKQAKLGQKLSFPTHTEELNSVARAFNELLGTLETNLVKYHEFASTAAHEIRTALMIISSIAQRSILKAGSSQVDTAMADILDEVDHLNRLTQGLMLLAQLENRSNEIDVSPEMLRPIVEQCIDTMSPLAEEKGQVLTAGVFGETEVWADKTMLKQALMNLVHNAIVHCPVGARIAVNLGSISKNTTTITVNDNGPGIPAEMRERIFERFATVSRKVPDKPSGGSHRGLGLGLSIARALVETQGGTLTLHSDYKPGSEFLVDFPTAKFYAVNDQAITG